MSLYAITTVTEVSLSAATKKTVLQLRGSTSTRAKLVAWGISLDGVDPTAAPAVVTLERQTTDGTGTAADERLFDNVDPAATLTGFSNFTVEPTAGDLLEIFELHPQGGIIVREYPPLREIIIDDATTSRIAITVTAPAAVNCVAWMHWDE